MEETQTLLFELEDSSPLSAADSSTLTNIANAVAKQGGSSAMTRSRSRNSSSIRVGWSQNGMRSRTKQAQSNVSSAQTLLASFVTSSAAQAFVKDSCDLLIRWQQGSAERSITFKHKDATFRLKGRDDIEELIRLLASL